MVDRKSLPCANGGFSFQIETTRTHNALSTQLEAFKGSAKTIGSRSGYNIVGTGRRMEKFLYHFECTIRYSMSAGRTQRY